MAANAKRCRRWLTSRDRRFNRNPDIAGLPAGNGRQHDPEVRDGAISGLMVLLTGAGANENSGIFEPPPKAYAQPLEQHENALFKLDSKE
jgi:hypothetical protein